MNLFRLNANVVPNAWLPPTRTPCVPGGIVESPSAEPTCSALPNTVVVRPSGVNRLPRTSV